MSPSQIKTALTALFLSLVLMACGSEPNPLFGAWNFETRTLNDAASGNDITESERYVFSPSKITLFKRCEIGDAATEVAVSAPILFEGTHEFKVLEAVQSKVSLTYQGNEYSCQADIPAGSRIYIVDEDGKLIIYDRDSDGSGKEATRAQN